MVLSFARFKEYAETTKKFITDLHAKLANQLAELDQGIHVLHERMNTLTRLEEGSTTGDAELQDIRVGYNSREYSDAGTAVREQIRSLANSRMAEGFARQNSSAGEEIELHVGLDLKPGSYLEFQYQLRDGFAYKMETPDGVTTYKVPSADSDGMQQYMLHIPLDASWVSLEGAYFTAPGVGALDEVSSWALSEDDSIIVGDDHSTFRVTLKELRKYLLEESQDE